MEVEHTCRRPAARDVHKRMSQDARMPGYAEHFRQDYNSHSW